MIIQRYESQALNGNLTPLSDNVKKRRGVYNMNRDFLKDLGLETDQVQEIMKEYGKSVNHYQDEIKKFEDKNEALNDKLKEVESSKDEVEKLNDKVEKLKEENKGLSESVKEYKKQVSQNELDKSILKHVSKDAHDPDDVFKFIDKEKFEYDEETGEVSNLEEVLTELRESKPYLFNGAELSGGVEQSTEEAENNEPKKQVGYRSSSQQGNAPKEIDYSALGKEQALKIFGNKQEDINYE